MDWYNEQDKLFLFHPIQRVRIYPLVETKLITEYMKWPSAFASLFIQEDWMDHGCPSPFRKLIGEITRSVYRRRVLYPSLKGIHILFFDETQLSMTGLAGGCCLKVTWKSRAAVGLLTIFNWYVIWYLLLLFW